MFYGLITLSWFDLISVSSTLLAIVALQLLNAIWSTLDDKKTDGVAPLTSGINEVTNSLKINELKSLISNDSTTNDLNTTTASDKNQKLQSEQNENHEDEDTLSLENLFPCDQSEIYASKKISFIIDEFVQTEENYVNNLKKGITNYGGLQKYDRLPEPLKGEDKQKVLLGNIAEILELHEKEILPLMLRNQRDLKSMFDEMAHHIDRNQFYCYITFTMHKKASLELRKENREFFQNYQNTINDRLGIDSFLVQPIQRLTRYPLLLQQLIAEFYKNAINCKPVLASLCKLETRMRRLLEVVNQSEEILSIDDLEPELDIEQLGCFRRSTDFDAYNHRSRKKFRSKVFLFDQCLLCTEVRKRRLAYKSYYAWHTIELKLNSSKSVSLLTKAAASGSGSHSSVKEEYEFSSPEAISINQWLRCARRIIEMSRIEESQRGKLVLPMDLVLGAIFATWFIWQYL